VQSCLQAGTGAGGGAATLSEEDQDLLTCWAQLRAFYEQSRLCNENLAILFNE
jgi:hypothetical protein